MTRVIRPMFAAVFLAATAPGQSFDVVSVKPGTDTFSTRPERSAGRLRWTTQVCYLVGYAYRVDFSHVSGPRCGDIYAIEATFAPSTSDAQLRAMVQSLLADRFKLRMRRLVTEAEGYALVLGKDRAKLTAAKEGDDSYVAATGPDDRGVITVTARRATVADLAATLARVIGTPIWDDTGIEGVLDFRFRYKLPEAADADAPELATALAETLGLKLQKQKGPVDSIVIDSIAEPSAN